NDLAAGRTGRLVFGRAIDDPLAPPAVPVTRRGALLFAAMCLIWGIPYLLIKVAVRDFSPPALVMLRTGIGAVVLLPFAFARGAVRPVLRRWLPLLVYTAVEL